MCDASAQSGCSWSRKCCLQAVASVVSLWFCSSLGIAVSTTNTATAAESVAVAGAGPVWERHVLDASSRGADGVKLGDINADGLPDVVTGWEEGGQVRVYLNPGPVKARDLWPHVAVGRISSPEDAVFADLDGDGRLEVVSCTEGKTRTVFWHRFSGNAADLLAADSWHTSAFPATQGAQAWMQALAIDLDGQHGRDLLLGSKNPNAAIGWLQSPPAPDDLAGWRYHRLRDAAWIMSLEAHDMDADGDLDVIFSDRKGARSGVYWLENPGVAAVREQEAWTERPIGAHGREVMFVDLTDLDGDGGVDVAAAVKPADIVLFRQQASGSFQEDIIHLDAANLGDAKAVKAADVNCDGRRDLLFTCENAAQESGRCCLARTTERRLLAAAPAGWAGRLEIRSDADARPGRRRRPGRDYLRGTRSTRRDLVREPASYSSSSA